MELADAYKHMGDRFENEEADALTKIVSDYPLSGHVAVRKGAADGDEAPYSAG